MIVFGHHPVQLLCYQEGLYYSDIGSEKYLMVEAVKAIYKNKLSH